MPFVARINLYPVKSCDGVTVQEAVVLPSGALQHDRRFALVDEMGRFVNAKSTPLIHRLRLIIDPVTREFHVGRREQGDELSGRLDDHAAQLSDWLTNYFSKQISLVENTETGFPDDLDANGPTVISCATLQTVAGWFPGLTMESVRLRFRANVEIDGVEPFWEDRLFRADKTPQPFRVGQLVLGGVNPCQRCVVPTRDQLTGDVAPDHFAKRFREFRERTLPEWAARDRFDHYYRLSTNTRPLSPHGGVLHVGDPVALVD